MKEPSFRDLVRQAWKDREIPIGAASSAIWIGSLILHAILLLAAHEWAVPPTPPPAEASLQTRLLEIPEPAEIEEMEPLVDLPPVETPAPSPDENISFDAATGSPSSAESEQPESLTASLSPVDSPSSDSISAMLEGENPRGLAALGRGGILSSRSASNKLGLLAAQGGSKETEEAVRWGLDWLARHQYPDGHWSLDHTPMAKGATTGGGQARSMVAATGMATLPFLASGYTHKEGPYRSQVLAALKYLVANQQPTGLLQAPQDSALFYSHGLAAIPLCEAYALTKDPYLEGPARGAIQFLLNTQNEAGGWRYNVGDGECDTSVLGWQLMAMKSARLAGIDVPEEAFDRCRAFLDRVRIEGSPERFGYMPTASGVMVDHVRSTTSIGQLCLQFMGLPRNDPGLSKSVDFLLTQPPSLEQARDCYYWYYATQVIHNFQGPTWDQWNRAMKRTLVRSQVTDSKSTDHGSWDPSRPSEDLWGSKPGGRHMVTCFHILCLEVYYRYLPIYTLDQTPGSASPKPRRPSDRESRKEKTNEPPNKP
jgi:hypothetical protein